METSKLKKFAQAARRQLIEQVGARLKLILQIDTAELREKEKAVKDLQEQIAKTSNDAVIERVAYIWFNRFCALRFMDVNRYTKVGTVSPAEGFSQPEILQEAKLGHIDVDFQVNQQKVFDLLGGKSVSVDPQQEAYRLLLVAVCNSQHKLMPFMFERIADYTELLIPEDLLSENSILHTVREAMTEENCKDVEIIGWLYQFYISEKKDEVINRRSVVAKDEIPAATQLFTPKWIVKYMVENSLGRLWMLNRPQSRLIQQMDYYVKHEQDSADFLRISKPEEIKLCDPACGSGHILVYAFDLLYAIYEEEGYDQKEIPNLIITKNLSGIEIDDRAGALAAFSLTMKARQKYRRFLRKPVQPNVCVLENVEFDEREIKNYMDVVGRDLFTMNLQATLHQFEEADNFGSLIRPDETNVGDVFNRLEAKGIGSNLFLVNTHQKVLKILNQADYLSTKYHVVIANPPYMGGKAMNGRLKAFLQDNYSNTKADLFAAFIIRNVELTVQGGQLGFVAPFVWMFISSYENLRNFILSKTTITCLAQLEYNAFAPACIPVATFTLENANHPSFKGGYIRLSDFRGCENQGPKTLEAIKNPKCDWFYRASAADLKKIPGRPIAYWASNRVRKVFETSASLGTIGSPTHGVVTGDNNRFLKNWSEVSKNNICFTAKTREDSVSSGVRWFPVSKGGPFRRWFGNNEFVIDWFNDGHELRTTKHHTGRIRATNFNLGRIFQPGITWSTISSSSLSMRYLPEGMIFESKGSVCFSDMEEQRLFLLALTNTHVINALLLIMSPTLDYHEGPMSRLPIVDIDTTKPVEIADACYQLSKRDWDSHESSWDFSRLPILLQEYRQSTLNKTYTKLNTHWQKVTREMRLLEEENNRIFINGYGVQDELKPEVPVKGITLSCNPHYRYGGDKREEELEVRIPDDPDHPFHLIPATDSISSRPVIPGHSGH